MYWVQDYAVATLPNYKTKQNHSKTVCQVLWKTEMSQTHKDLLGNTTSRIGRCTDIWKCEEAHLQILRVYDLI